MVKQVDPTKGLQSMSFVARPDSAATVQAHTPNKRSYLKTQTPLNVRTSSTNAGDGSFNVHQAIPAGFSRHNSIFSNVLQDNIRAGFPTKNFQRMSNAKTRETMLQLHRDASMATSQAITGMDTAASMYRTAGPAQKERSFSSHKRAQSAQGFAKTASGPFLMREHGG